MAPHTLVPCKCKLGCKPERSFCWWTWAVLLHSWTLELLTNCRAKLNCQSPATSKLPTEALYNVEDTYPTAHGLLKATSYVLISKSSHLDRSPLSDFTVAENGRASERGAQLSHPVGKARSQRLMMCVGNVFLS